MNVKKLSKWKKLLEKDRKKEVIEEIELLIKERKKRLQENRNKKKGVYNAK